MGTLGCINDMMQRDKENRQLRKRNRDRMKETRNRLIDIRNKTDLADVSPEEWEEIQRQIAPKEATDSEQLFRLKFLVLASIGGIVLLGFILYLIFF